MCVFIISLLDLTDYIKYVMYTSRPYYKFLLNLLLRIRLVWGFAGCRFVLMHRVFIIANKPSPLNVSANLPPSKTAR